MKIKLIEDWKKAHKMLSVQAMTVAGFLLTIQTTWDMLPPQLVSLIPQKYLSPITLAVLTIGFIGRFIQQFAVKADDAAN